MEDTDNIHQVVIDASVALAWLLPKERFTRSAEKFLHEAVVKGVILHAPTLIDYEVTNAIRSSVLTKRISKPESRELITVYRKIELTRVDYSSYFEETVEISVEKDLSVYDAAYIAVAMKQKWPFFTYDERLYRKLTEDYAFIKLLGEK